MDKMKIGITFDSKEDYNFSSDDWTYSDFSTMIGISYLKKNIERCGYEVILLGNYKNLLDLYKSNNLRNIDLIFNNAEGLKSRNREGWIPSFLEMIEIPCVGSDVFAQNLSLNKIFTKIVCSYLNIPTPSYFRIDTKKDIKIIVNKIEFPAILKPNYEGSSTGVILVKNKHQFTKYATYLLKVYEQTIICEKYIEGREITVPIIGNKKQSRCLGLVETIRKDGNPIGIYGIEEKFSDICEKIIPDVNESIKRKIMLFALLLHNYIGCKDYNRVDFRLDENGGLHFLEMNPLPDMAEESSYSMCCNLQNIPFYKIIQEIIEHACTRYSQEKMTTYSNS